MAIISVPDVEFAGFYYPEVLRELLLDLRRNREELGLTDENDFEVHVQLLRAFALVAHLNNVRLDTVANELLIGSATLLESLKRLLRLIGIELKSATPAAAEVLLKLSAPVSSLSVDFIPVLAEFSTESVPPIAYEDLNGLDLDPSDEVSYALGLNETKSGEGSVATTSPDIFTRFADDSFAATDVGDHLFVFGSAADNGGEFRIVEFIDADNVRVVRVPGSTSPGFQTETDLVWSLKTFTDDVALDVNTAGPTFTPWPVSITSGDLLFVGHNDVLPGQLDVVFGTVGSDFTGVFEYFDNTLSNFTPLSVVDNFDGTITMNVNSLLGLPNRTGAIVNVTHLITGAREQSFSIFSGGNNIVITETTMGQTTVSTDIEDYSITADWVPFENQTDGTSDFTSAGAVTYNLPQTEDRNWQKTEVNLNEAYWIRYRIVSVAGGPTSPDFDRLRIDLGDQYLVRTVTQGETIGPQILGSSDGSVSQEFTLPETPYIDDTETVEVDEAGSGTWVTYAKVDTFLSSAATSRHYIRETNAEDVATVRFGDGINGKIPPTGTDNVRATYRIGADVDGNVGIGEIVTNSDGVFGIAEVSNPRPAIGWRQKDGGSEADIERLKRDAPAELRVRGSACAKGDVARLAVQDFVDASGIKPVARAFEVEEGLGPKTVKLLVVGLGGSTLSSDQRSDLEIYFNGDKNASPPITGKLMLNYEVTVFNFEPRLISVETTVTWPGGNAQRIKAALLNLLTPLALEEDNVTFVHEFGGTVSLSRVFSAIHEVDPNIEDVPSLTLNGAAASVVLGDNELPISTAANITVNIQETA